MTARTDIELNPSELRVAVGQRLRVARARRDEPQRLVAERAHITQASLSNYETGKRDIPLSTLLRLSEALDVSVGDLLQLPHTVALRDSRLGRALQILSESPDLLDSILNRAGALEAAS